MDFVYVLLPLALLLGFIALMAFMWTLRSGQYEDLDGAAWRAIMDDDEHLLPNRKKTEEIVKDPPNSVDNTENRG